MNSPRKGLISLYPTYNNVILWEFTVNEPLTHSNKERGMCILHTGKVGFRLC